MSSSPRLGSNPGPPAASATDPEDPGAADRRQSPRLAVELPVRIQIDGVPGAHSVELRDLSMAGCFVRPDDHTPAVLSEQEVAIGFVLPTAEVALARGRVRRDVPGVGFAVAFEETNGSFDRFLLKLWGDRDHGALLV